VQVLENGRFIPKEQSWLISYDADQLGWARLDLLAGTLDEAALDQGYGIVAVFNNLRHNRTSEPVSWHIGDRVMIDTPTGPQEKTVMGILRSVPFSDSNLNMTTLITTEKQYTALTGQDTLLIIDVQLRDTADEQTVRQIQTMLGPEISFHDQRQANAEVDQAFFTIAVFVYGFVVVIALISVLNIANTIQTSVAAKTRYLGVLRAVGMTGGQLNRMVLAEVGTYNLLGCGLGCGLGVLIQRNLTTSMLGFAHIPWHFPWPQLGVIALLTILVTLLATLQPLRQIRSRGITEVIGSL